MDEKMFLDAVVAEFKANYERVEVSVNRFEDSISDCYNVLIKYYKNSYDASVEQNQHKVCVTMQHGRPVNVSFSEFACVEDNWAWKTLMRRFVLGE